MALPGIISCLHAVSTPAELSRQLMQGQQSRAEAFWLPAAMHEQAAAVLTALGDNSSLFLERPVSGLALRSHDGVLQAQGLLLLNNGHRIALAREQGDGGLVPEPGLAEMTQWLEAGHRHFCCSAAVQPVARAILNIWPLDPYLARHFLLSFTPLLREATQADYLAVFQARAFPVTAQSDWVKAYMKLEKRLHRAYLDH